MRYNYYYLCLHVLFLLGLVTSCSNDIDYTYKGSNYIQISTADDPAIAENDDRPVTVDVLLATAVETDATIHFELSGNEDGVLNMENDGSVLIKAGEKKASFKIASIMPSSVSEMIINNAVLWSPTISSSISS